MDSKGKNLIKIIIILGPTASGKSGLAVSLAKKFNGEVISADSRQVYRGMDIGTGKITEEEMEGVPHHLLDVASPKRNFTVTRFQAIAEKAIKKIDRADKIPFVCGGTAFYIKVLSEGITVPDVSPDWRLRKELEKESSDKLYEKLKKLDPRRAKTIDSKNKRRLVRAIEVISKTGKSVPVIKKTSKYNPLLIGTNISQKELDKKIKKRLLVRIDQGMIEEVKSLKEAGLSWKRINSFGLEYKWCVKYLQNEVSYQEFIEHLFIDIRRFSKKQMQWWKDDKRIKWVKNSNEASNIVKNFLK